MRRLHPTLALLTGALLAVTTLVAPAQAAPAQPPEQGSSARQQSPEQTVSPSSAVPGKGYVVQPGVQFNDPTGKAADRYRLSRLVEKALDNAPKGSTVRLAQYLFDLDSSADAIIAAAKRGVAVHVLLDDYPATPQVKRVRAALGTNRSKPSYVVRCHKGCMSSVPSVMHAKFFLFSQTGQSEWVSLVSSANLYTGNTKDSWNNMHSIVGDKVLYTSLSRYFDDMMKDKDDYDYYRTTTSGIYKLYFYPRTAVAGSADVPLLDVVNHVRCSGVAKGYGYQGRTVVRIAQWGWSGARLDVARRLWTLHDQGCLVQVIGNNYKFSDSVRRVLLRPSSRYGVMPYYNAGIDTNGNGKRDVYMHHKMLSVNGVWFGHNDTKVVYTGSANLTGPGLLYNNETMLRVIDARTYNAYAKNFAYIRDHWTVRSWVAPVATGSVAQRQLAERRLDAELAAGSPES